MTYQKPEVLKLGAAISTIQTSLEKSDRITDSNNTLPSVDAYRSDE